MFQLSFAFIGNFFQVYIYNRLPEQFSGSQAGFGTTFRDIGSFQKAGTSSLKRVTERHFTVSTVRDFKAASRTFIFGLP
jgi:hypothetical protein